MHTEAVLCSENTLKYSTDRSSPPKKGENSSGSSKQKQSRHKISCSKLASQALSRSGVTWSYYKRFGDSLLSKPRKGVSTQFNYAGKNKTAFFTKGEPNWRLTLLCVFRFIPLDNRNKVQAVKGRRAKQPQAEAHHVIMHAWINYASKNGEWWADSSTNLQACLLEMLQQLLSLQCCDEQSPGLQSNIIHTHLFLSTVFPLDMRLNWHGQ